MAHAGGFVGGLLAGLVLAFSERRGESFVERLIALGLLGLTALSFARALWNAFVA
jgi:hypothetical protein